MKRSIRQNRYGNWRGYIGGRFVREFGNGVEQTAEQAARTWQAEELKPEPAPRWREHFSTPAGDILQIAAALAGFDLKDVLLRCFKRSPKGSRINEPTVLAVLQEVKDEDEARAEALWRELRERSE